MQTALRTTQVGLGTWSVVRSVLVTEFALNMVVVGEEAGSYSPTIRNWTFLSENFAREHSDSCQSCNMTKAVLLVGMNETNLIFSIYK